MWDNGAKCFINVAWGAAGGGVGGGGVSRLSDVAITLLRVPAAWGGEDASLGAGAFGDTLPLPDTTPSLTGPMTSLW